MAEPTASPPLLHGKQIVVLPDLYIDAVAHIGPWSQARHHMDEIAGHGGGNLPVGPVEFRIGGNAANLALGLARLGANVDLVAETNPLGMHLMQRAADKLPLRLDSVRVGERTAATMAMETDDANVMLSHAGPVAHFGPQHMTREEWQRIENADAVAVTNWAQTLEGTQLLETIAQRLAGSNVFLYLDTGDPRHRMAEVPHLLSCATIWKNASAWGMNENEAHAFTTAANLPPTNDASLAAGALAQHLGTRIDLHTRTQATTHHPDGTRHTESLPTNAPAAQRLTGAGDAWNAGNLTGYLLHWPDATRLQFAHQTATQHVTKAWPQMPPNPPHLAKK